MKKANFTTMKSNRSITARLVILAAGAFVTIAAFIGVAPIHITIDPEVAARIARSRISEAAARYAGAEAEDIAATRQAIHEILTAAHKEVSGKADVATRPFRGFYNATSCAAMGTKDKLRGGHELQDYIQHSLEPATVLLSSAREKILVQMMGARQNALVRANHYRKETLQFARDAGISPTELDAGLPAIGAMAETLDHSVNQTIAAGIGASLELVFIRSTITILMSVLEPAIATAAGTAGAAGTACVIDGPSPVGKIIGATIAVGGSAWTAKEIWQAIDEINRLPGKIEGLLNEQLDGQEKAATGALDQIEASFQPLFTPVL